MNDTIPVELYAGPLCGQPMMVQPDQDKIEVTCAETGELVAYASCDLTSRKGCKVFRFAPNQPHAV